MKMINHIILLSALLIGHFCFGQTPIPYDSTLKMQLIPGGGFNWKNGEFEGKLRIPRHAITMANKDSGAIAYKNGVLRVWTGTKWDTAGYKSPLNPIWPIIYNPSNGNFYIDSAWVTSVSTGSSNIDTTNNTYLTWSQASFQYLKKIDSTGNNGYSRNWQITDVLSKTNVKLNASDTGSLSNRVNSKLNISDSTGNNGYSRNWQITDVLSKVNRFDSTGYMHIKYSIPETITGVKSFSDSTFLNGGPVVGVNPTTTTSSRRLTFRSIATNGTLMESWLQQEGVTTPGTEALKFYTNGYMQFAAYGNNGANKGIYQFAYDAKIWGQTGLRLYTTSTTSGVSIGNEYNQTSGTLFNVFNNTSTQYFSILSNGSIGINNSSPSSSALLDLTSSTKGLLIPRMTTSQRDAISSPATGLIVWNNNTSTLDAYQGNSWGSIAGDYSRQLKIQTALGSPFKAEPYFGLAGTNGSSNLTNATGFYMAFLLEKETTLTGIYWFQGSSGVYTNDLYSGFSIYQPTGTNTLTKLVESTNDAALFKGTVGTWQNKAFSSTITLAPGVYYVGMLWRGTSITAIPAVYGTSSLAAMNIIPGTTFKLSYQISGQNGFPATINVSSSNTSTYYWSLFPY